MLIEAPLHSWSRECQPRAPVTVGRSEANPTACDIRRMRGKHKQYDANDELPFVSMGDVRPGSYGRVDKVRSKTSSDIVFARKRWWKHDQRSRSKHLEEIRLLSKLEHWHIVEVVTSYQKEDELGCLMAPFANIDLRNLLRSEICPKSTLKRGLGCLVAGLAFIHQENIIHGDIKPGNILLHDDRFLYADFGCSKDVHGLDKSATEATVPGTPAYAAPELFEHLPRGRSADVFSLGCVLMEIFSVMGDHGSQIEVPTSFVALAPYAYHIPGVKSWLRQRAEEHGSAVESMWLDICSKMLQVEPKDRPRAHELHNIIASKCEQGQKDGIFCTYCVRQGVEVCSSPVDQDTDPEHTEAELSLAHERVHAQVSQVSRHHDL